jgi:hypothetical protein
MKKAAAQAGSTALDTLSIRLRRLFKSLRGTSPVQDGATVTGSFAR